MSEQKLDNVHYFSPYKDTRDQVTGLSQDIKK